MRLDLISVLFGLLLSFLLFLLLLPNLPRRWTLGPHNIKTLSLPLVDILIYDHSLPLPSCVPLLFVVLLVCASWPFALYKLISASVSSCFLFTPPALLSFLCTRSVFLWIGRRWGRACRSLHLLCHLQNLRGGGSGEAQMSIACCHLTKHHVEQNVG